MIAEETGGELFKIEIVTTYPVTYDEMTAIARDERDRNARQELNSVILLTTGLMVLD